MKYIRFEKDAETHEGKPLYTVLNIRANEPIAQIFWYSAWRKWCMRFRKESVLNG